MSVGLFCCLLILWNRSDRERHRQQWQEDYDRRNMQGRYRRG